MKHFLGALLIFTIFAVNNAWATETKLITAGKLKCGDDFELKLPVEAGDILSFWGEELEALPVEGDYIVHARMRRHTYEFKVSKDGVWYEKENSPTWKNHGKKCSVVLPRDVSSLNSSSMR